MRTVSAATEIVEDVTAKLRMEKVLRETERKRNEMEVSRFKAILDNTTDLVMVISPDFKIEYLNRAGRILLNCDTEEDLSDVQLTEFAEEESAAMLLETGLPYAAEHSVWSSELIFHSRDGREFPTLQVLIAHETPGGQIAYYSLIATDVTELKETALALRKSQERLRAIFDNAAAGIAMIDGHDKFVEFNETWCEMLGYTREELLHLGPTEVSADPTLPVRKDTDGNDPEQFRMERQYRRKDGSLFWGELNAVQLLNDGGLPEAMLGIIIDVSERRAAEEKIHLLNEELERRVLERTAELQEVNRELEAFCYSVSHDLRTPLRGIDGFSHALMEDNFDQLDAKGRDYVQRVRQAAKRMSQLIDDLLTLSRLGRADMHLTEVDLSGLATEISDELRGQFPGHKVSVKITPGITCPAADENLLRNALSNLLHNAWKFTGKTENAVVEFGTQNGDGRTVYFVSDNGAGFDMRFVDKLFGAFQRLHSLDEFEGSGIGLASVQRIIRRHGGRIWAEGSEDEGATFYFTLNSQLQHDMDDAT